MRHHALTAAIGVGLAVALVPLSVTSAAAADPRGYWRKAEQGERPAKMQVYRCGSGKRYLCVKIAWLKDPLDSKGKPLRDVRNSNASLRGREIMGLPIVKGMAKVRANQWKGNIYNPEDGNTYSATLTMVSRNKIVLKGCKAFLLCGERVWLRTSAPSKPEPETEPQIEASVEPDKTPSTASATATANASASANPLGNAEMMVPAAQQSVQPGYRFLTGTAVEEPAGFSGENVPSMFVMTKPLADDAQSAGQTNPVGAAERAAPAAPASAATATAPVQQEAAIQPAPAARPAPAAQRAPAPRPKPPAPTVQANAAPSAQPQAAPRVSAPPVSEPGMPALSEEAVETGETVDAETESAEAAVAQPRRLTWRERRKLRRQQRLMQQEGQGLLPWLR